ncbi:MAG: tetratricopeptide repeat protein [Candidatus Hydrogenedentes bacterium]|nr:tetratricopeptide repeat protein [Candidatus Hydrogenedentota bacterium]
MFDWKRNKIEGILAASLYEPLTESEQRLLNTAIASDPALRAEYEAMRRMTEAIPRVPVHSIPNIVPFVRERLETPAKRRPAFRIAHAAAAMLLITGMGVGAWYVSGPNPVPLVRQTQSAGNSGTLMAQALAEANTLIEKKEFPAAYETLRKALSRQPSDELAGEAQWLAADMAYDLKRYPDALAGYTALLGSYRDTLEGSERKTEAIHRHLLLDEAKDLQFASIYAYDAALRDRTDTFTALESVIASYQGQKQYEVCDQAAADLVQLAVADAGSSADSPVAMVTAYAMARERCTSPVAAALLDLKAGDVFRDDLSDYPQAELHYQRAAENPVLAGRAHDALQHLAKLKQ